MAKLGVAAFAVAACVALALPIVAGATLTESCSDNPKVATSFCVTSDLTASSATAAAPFGIDLSASDTSTNFSSDTSEWMNQATLHLATVGTSAPLITPSASMPDGLRIAGGLPCSAPAYTDCSAGHGVIAGNISGTFGFFDGYHEGTFGVASVVNVADAGAGNLAHYVININYCIPGLGLPCLIQSSVAADAVIADGPGASGLTFPTRTMITQPIGGCGCSATGDVTVKSITLHSDAQSSVLVNGDPAGGTFAPLRLPANCGAATADATFLAGDNARTVSASRTFAVGGCPTASFSKTVSGSTAHLNGGGSSTPVGGRSIAKWEWDFGDGAKQITTSPTVTHTYSASTNRTIALVAVDSAGARSTPVSQSILGTRTTLSIRKTRHRIKTRGTVGPSHSGTAVLVELLRRRHRHFARLREKRAAVSESGAYATSFRRPSGGRCRAVVTYPGDPTHFGSTATRTFRC